MVTIRKTNMSAILKKLNTLVADTLGSEVGDIDATWVSNADVQKQLKSLLSGKQLGRGKKDPNAPKRGKSAYLFFCAANRDSVKSALGADAKATDITKELGVRWNKLKESSKPADKKALASFESEAQKDKDRYDGEKAEYVPVDVDESDSKRRGGKAKKEGPKRAKSAYLYFCDAHRDEVKSKHPEFKATEITSELGRMWNLLKDDKSRQSELAKYSSLADADKARYESEKSGGVQATPKAAKQAKAKTTKVVEKVEKAKAPKKKQEKQEKVVEQVVEEELVEEEVKAPVKSKSSKKSASKKRK
jgi:hypothetical protein